MRHILTLAALSCGLHGIAQHTDHDRRCISHEITQRFLEERGLPTDLTSPIAQMELEERGGTLTIPVVFHVVYNNNAENIPASTIQAVIQQMNQDYSASNSNLGTVRNQFQGSIANVGIEFCLATTDPQGNPTNGITRTPTTATWFNPDTQTDAMKSPPLGKSPWDPLRYLNIWVCDIHSGAGGGGITLGYAYMPNAWMVGSNVDGIVIDYLYGMSLAYRTATHEAGHYLGVPHTWGNGGCANDDGYTDTPNTDSPTFSCSNQNLTKCGVLTQYENFMDYSDCPAMFTLQQRTAMRNTLTGLRNMLLTSNGCSGGGTGGTTYCTPTSAQGTTDGDYVNSVQLGGINNMNTGGVGAPAYADYTAQSTTLVKNASYTITIQSGQYAPNRVAAWIDYNNDQQFQSNEKLGEFQTTGSLQSQGINFTVPASAASGSTRLRVRSVYVNTGEPNPVDPCYSYDWGQTEDYTVVIDGSVNVTAIDAADLALFPNPARGTATLVLPTSTPAQVYVLDAQGRTVRTHLTNAQRTDLDLEGLAPGHYLVRVVQDDVHVLRLSVTAE